MQLLAQEAVSPFRFKFTLNEQEIEEQVCRSFSASPGAQPPMPGYRKGDWSSTKKTDTSSKSHRFESAHIHCAPILEMCWLLRSFLASPHQEFFLGCAGRGQEVLQPPLWCLVAKGDFAPLLEMSTSAVRSCYSAPFNVWSQPQVNEWFAKWFFFIFSFLLAEYENRQ